jgi:hypothetical protein
MRRRIALLLAAAATPVAALLVWAPSAFAFTCPDRDVCFFQNNDYTGNTSSWTATNPDNRDTWLGIPSGERGSVNNNTDSAVEAWNAQNNVPICIPARTRAVLNNMFGYWYLHYGVNSCQGVPSGP